MNTKVKPPHLKAVDPEALETVMKASQEAASRQFEGAMKTAAEQMEKSGQRMTQMSQQMTEMNRDLSEALMQCMTASAKGCEEVSRGMMTFGQSCAEQAMATGKSMLSAKTMREYVDLQTEFMKQTMDAMIAETQRCNEITARTAQEAFEPLSQRVSAVIERFAQTAQGEQEAA